MTVWEGLSPFWWIGVWLFWLSWCFMTEDDDDEMFDVKEVKCEMREDLMNRLYLTSHY